MYDIEYSYLADGGETGIKYSLNSFKNLLAHVPDILLPSHGDIIEEPIKDIEEVKKKFEQVRSAFRLDKVLPQEELMNSFKEFSDTWQKALNQQGTDAFKQFAENWQKNLAGTGMKQMEAYGEMMKKFAETWSSMWPVKSK